MPVSVFSAERLRERVAEANGEWILAIELERPDPLRIVEAAVLHLLDEGRYVDVKTACRSIHAAMNDTPSDAIREIVDRALASGVFAIGETSRLGMGPKIAIHRLPTPRGTVRRGLEEYVGARLATSPVDQMTRLADFLHRIRLAFATRVRSKDGETDLTVSTFSHADVPAFFDAANPTLGRDVFFVRRDGRLIGRDEFMAAPLEHYAFEIARSLSDTDARTARRSIPQDLLCIVDVERFVGSAQFQEALRRHGVAFDTNSIPPHPKAEIERLLAAGACFSLACTTFLDREVVDLMTRARQFLAIDPSEMTLTTPRTRKDPEVTLAYRWMTPKDPIARRNRRQAFAIAPYALGHLVDHEDWIDRGGSVVDAVADGLKPDLPRRHVAAAMAAACEATPMPTKDRGGAASSAQMIRVRMIAQLFGRLGGSNILDLADADTVGALAHVSLPAPVGVEDHLGRAMLRDPRETVALLNSGLEDFAEEVSRLLVSAWRTSDVDVGSSEARGLPERVVAALLGPGVGIRPLARANREWHGNAGEIQEAIETLRAASLEKADAPTVNPVVLPGGTITWLLTSAELRDEGNALDHCVASYAPKVMSHRSFVASVVTKDGERATLEMAPKGEAPWPARRQFRTTSNENPPYDCHRLLRDFEKAIGEGAIEWTDPPAVGRNENEPEFPPTVSAEDILDLIRPVLPARCRSWTASDWARETGMIPDPSPTHDPETTDGPAFRL